MQKYRLTRDQVREVDRRAIEQLGIPGIVLMENAARQAAGVAWQMLEQLGKTPPDPQGDDDPTDDPLVTPPPRVAVLCGAGNNGGDGYAMARHLHNRGASVELFAAKPVDELQGDAATNAQICRRMDLSITQIDQPASLDTARWEWANSDLLVDALLGTGIRGEPRPPFDAIINAMGELTGPLVLAVDIPSGLDCDTGEAAGPCVRADATVTFVAPKAGFAGEKARQYTGQVHIADIGAPPRLVMAVLGD